MVAREYWNGKLFARICQMACNIAKHMGLQRISGSPTSDPSSEDKEKADLFWTLYIMDKERAFMSGIPPDIYLFDTDVRLSGQESGYTLPHYRVALIHMMSLWEDIHMSLYSSRVGRERASQVDTKVSKLNTRLSAWATRHIQLLDNAANDSPWFPYLSLELRYVFHVAQILTHRCGSSNESKQRRIIHARAALSIIKYTYDAAPSLRNAALLRR